MALFDNINSRYATRSMAQGGTYAEDAAAGGFNRTELRGLKKQSRRGTLTQRERARLNYLTKTRKGRVGRGLLAGLGGVAATLGGLALAKKLGGGKEGGGLGLMEAIKAKFHDRKVRKAEDEQWDRRDLGIQQELADDNLASVLEGTEDRKERPGAGEIDAMGDIEEFELEEEEEGDIEGEKTGEQLKQEALDARTELGRRMREEGEAHTQMELGRHSDTQDTPALLQSLEGAEGPGEFPNTLTRALNDPDFARFGAVDVPGFPTKGPRGEGPDMSWILNKLGRFGRSGIPLKTSLPGPRANIGMRVNPGKQKRDLIRQYMNNRYR